MRNLNKKQNLVEQARIKLDEEKIAHSITLVRVGELENIIKEAIKYIESYMPNYDFDKTNLIKLLEILRGDK